MANLGDLNFPFFNKGEGSNSYPPEYELWEKESFRKLQKDFTSQFEMVFPDKLAPKTVVIIPSLSLDQEILSKIDGIVHYEERMLCLLLLLRMPRTNLIYITSTTMDPVIIDYYLHLLPGVSNYHARQRLTLLSCYDISPRPLTEKILERPRLMKRILDSIPPDHAAHITCFNVTPLERTLSVQLQLPVYGCDPDLYELGNKSNGRILFRECGLKVPNGFENCRDESDIVKGLYELKRMEPGLMRAVVKLNEGFSGEGNAVFSYGDKNPEDITETWIREQLPHNLITVAKELKYEEYMENIEKMGGVVESFLMGKEKRSPSVQCRINPLGDCDVLSTHDQVLGGNFGQIFTGAYFPASPEYAVDTSEAALRVSKALQQRGVIGRLGIDFLSIKENDNWEHFALEINLRKGGTTHPYLMLQFLTDGHYDAASGNYYTANNQTRYYYATDNLKNKRYIGLTSHDLVDIAINYDLMYDGAKQQGVMFHLIGALSQYGKLGLVCIGDSPQQAELYYQRTVEVLDKEGRN
jgi:PGM1 C-terminal domain